MKVRNLILLAAVVLMSAAACNKHEVVRRGDQSGDNPSEQEGGDDHHGGAASEPVNNKDWSIGYKGRQDYRESDGTVARVDAIEVSGITAPAYLVSVISRDNYASYEGDVKAFIDDEVKYNSDYVYTDKSQVIYFDVFRHGTWYAFVIGLNANKTATYEYAYAQIEIQEETPNEAYAKWLGAWSLTGDWKGMGVTYEITVSQIEANYVYRVDGWETGKSIDKDNGTVMDQEYLETFFDAPSGSMFFVSQYLGSYEDENLGNGDECFLGQIDYEGILEPMGLYVINDEGIDLAEAMLDADGNSAGVFPCSITANISDREPSYETTFFNMSYFFGANNAEGVWTWYPYNQNIPGFPLSMVRKGDGSASAPKALCGRRSTHSKDAMPERAKVHRPRAERQHARALRVR